MVGVRLCRTFAPAASGFLCTFCEQRLAADLWHHGNLNENDGTLENAFTLNSDTRTRRIGSSSTHSSIDPDTHNTKSYGKVVTEKGEKKEKTFVPQAIIRRACIRLRFVPTSQVTAPRDAAHPSVNSDRV